MDWEELAALAKLRWERFERDPRLDAHHHVCLRVLEHAVEGGRPQLDAISSGRIAHLSCPATADRKHRQPRLARFVDASGKLLSGCRLLGDIPSYHPLASLARPVPPVRWGTRL